MRDFRPVGRWTLAGRLSSAGEARALIRAEIPQHPGLEDVELVASELVANAVEHGEGLIEVALDEAPGLLRLSVTSDAGAVEPAVLPPSTDDEGGRGLALVSALAERWGWERIDGRLAVWAEFADR